MRTLWALLLAAGTMQGQECVGYFGPGTLHTIHNGGMVLCALLPISTRKPPRLPLVEAELPDNPYLCSGSCMTSMGRDLVYRVPVEPVDAPAIQVPDRDFFFTQSNPDFPWCSWSTGMCSKDRPTVSACKKGSGRILLEDVDGGKHCLKF